MGASRATAAGDLLTSIPFAMRKPGTQPLCNRVRDRDYAHQKLAQPIEASFAKPDLNAPTSVSISASVIGVENVHVPVLMMLQPSL